MHKLKAGHGKKEEFCKILKFKVIISWRIEDPDVVFVNKDR